MRSLASNITKMISFTGVPKLYHPNLPGAIFLWHVLLSKVLRTRPPVTSRIYRIWVVYCMFDLSYSYLDEEGFESHRKYWLYIVLMKIMFFHWCCIHALHATNQESPQWNIELQDREMIPVYMVQSPAFESAFFAFLHHKFYRPIPQRFFDNVFVKCTFQGLGLASSLLQTVWHTSSFAVATSPICDFSLRN